LNLTELSKTLSELGEKNSRIFHYVPAQSTYTKKVLMKKLKDRTIRLVAIGKSKKQIDENLNEFLGNYVVLDDSVKNKAKKILTELTQQKQMKVIEN